MALLTFTKGVDWAFAEPKTLRQQLVEQIGERYLPDRPGPRWTLDVGDPLIKVELHDPTIVESEIEAVIAAHGAVDHQAQVAEEHRRRLIDQVRDATIEAGVEFMGYTFDADQRSILNLVGTMLSVQAGIPLPEGFTWRTKDNQDVPVDAVQLAGLGQAMMAHNHQAYLIAWYKKDHGLPP